MKKFLLSLALALVAVCAIGLAACTSNPESVEKPNVQTTEFVYDGTEKTLLSDGEFYTVSGNKATDAGSYTATATLTDKKKYAWADGTTDDVQIDWTINKASIEKPTAAATSYTYNGKEITVINAATGYTVSGNTATDAGSYTATATLTDKQNYAWADETTDDVTVNWTINKVAVEKPVATTTQFTYSGSEITVVNAGTGYTVSGNKATAVGSYTATATLTDKTNYAWADGTSDNVTINWSIKKISVAVPTVSDSLVYTGNAITAFESSDYYTVTEATKTDAGNYLSTLTLKDTATCEWADGTTSVKRISWSIAKAQYDTSAIVFENATHPYDGTAHTLTIKSGLPEGVTASYTTNTLTDVGSIDVTATFTVSANYEQTVLKATLTVTQVNNTFVTALTDLKIYDNDEQALVCVYNGKAVSLNVESAHGDTAVSYYTLAEDKYTKVDAPVKAGTYYVRAIVDETVNYSGLDSDYVKLVIQKATYDLSAVTYVTDYEFDGTEHTVAVNNLPQGVTASVSASSVVPCEQDATITFTGDSENYNAIAPVTKKLTVTVKVVNITTYEQLQSSLLDEQLNFDRFYAQHIIYRLSNDIDCENKVWTAVGDYDVPFMSNFDGNGHVIKNMLINEDSGKFITTGGGLIAYAMFGALGGAAQIHDVTFDNFNVNVSTNKVTGGNYYAFICGRIPNGSGNTVMMYNITIKNSLINVKDNDRNKTRLGGLIAWDYSDDSKRDNVVIKDTDIVYVGEPDGQGTSSSGTCYIGGIAGEIDGNASNGLGRSYSYTNCTFEGGNIVVVSTTTVAPWIGGIFGYVIGTITLTNVNSDANIYRFCGNKDGVAISTIGTINVNTDDGTVQMNLKNWIGRPDGNMPTPTINDCDYTGNATLIRHQDTTVEINNNVTLASLPDAFSVKYLIGETEVTQISLNDFGKDGNINSSVTVNAQITYNEKVISTISQKFNLSYAFADTSVVGDSAVGLNMQLPEGYSVKYFKGDEEVTQISRTDFGNETSLVITAKVMKGDNLFGTLQQTFTTFGTFAQTTEVGDDAIVFAMQLPEGYSVKYFKGDEEVTQISRTDFGNETSLVITAKVMKGDELFGTLQQTFTTFGTFAQTTEVGDDAIVFDMQLPEGYSVKYFKGDEEVTQISATDFEDVDSVTITAKIYYNDEVYCTISQEFTLNQE